MSCALCMDIAMTVCDSQVLPAWRSTGQASTSLPAPASSFLPSSVQHSGVTDTNMQAPLTVATSSNTGSGATSGGASCVSAGSVTPPMSVHPLCNHAQMQTAAAQVLTWLQQAVTAASQQSLLTVTSLSQLSSTALKPPRSPLLLCPCHMV